MDSEEGARTSSMEPDSRGSETAQAFAFLRRRRLDLSPVQESYNANHRGGPAQSSLESWREPGGSSSNNSSSGRGGSGSGSSWLSSSFRNRCPPLFSRHRREGREESAHSAAALEDSYSRPQHLLRRWDDPDHKASEEDDENEEEDEEDDEEEVGAVGVEAPGSAGASTVMVQRMQGPRGQLVFTPPPRVRVYEDIFVAVDPMDGVESQSEPKEKDKPVPSRDPERLRKIQERCDILTSYTNLACIFYFYFYSSFYSSYSSYVIHCIFNVKV